MKIIFIYISATDYWAVFQACVSAQIQSFVSSLEKREIESSQQ